MNVFSNARSNFALIRSFHRNSERGFALICTLMMMMLLAVLCVGMLSLSTVTLRTTSTDAAQATARMNARLALSIAIGEVQKNLGPDMRISARAATLCQDKRIGSTVAPSSPQAWWVGATHSDGTTGLGDNKQPVVWLVSGLTGQSPKTQLESPFESPVEMIGDGCLDLATHTGGSPITAGRVMLHNSKGDTTGAYAYFVDDEGMKAQLVASSEEVRNDRDEGNPLGGGVIPGTYSLGILENMAELARTDGKNMTRIVSLNNLPVAGVSKSLMKKKFFGYTMRSYGVLTDVKKGGLKKDLTVAFENDDVFNTEFPRNDLDKFLLVDPKKRTGEMDANGYIHWDILKDYYNLKKQIRMRDGLPAIELTLFDKTELLSGTGALGQGRLGPHQMGPAGSAKANPYGEFKMTPLNEEYKHNPITSILSHMQQNAWVEYKAGVSGAKGKLVTHAQLWTSHYNPYNISIYARGEKPKEGPRIINFPQVLFTVGSGMNRVKGFHDKQEVHVGNGVVLQPGRSHVFGFKDNALQENSIDAMLYTDKVKDLTLESVYKEYETNLGSAGKTNLTIEYFMDRPTLAHGVDQEAGNATNGDFELAQVFFAPFSWNQVKRTSGSETRPGISKSFPVMPAGSLNENTMFSQSFVLRTTREAGNRIRPLVDANIRAVWNNPKWDSPLNLPLLASYSDAGAGVAEEQLVPMNTDSPPYGHGYWGGSHDPVHGVDRVILFDVPREDLVSLGQLQHAAAGRFSYEPTYVVGNSYANIRIPAGEWQASISDTYSTARPGLTQWAIPGNFNLYDSSYLVNEVLWDSYIFTTLPQSQDNYQSTEEPPDYDTLLTGKTFLPNPRFIPYEPAGSTFTEDVLKDGSTGAGGSFHHNAGYVLVDGAFNVNSTSVDAWEAFLSGTYQLPVPRLNGNNKDIAFSREGIAGVRFPRVKTTYGTGMQTSALNDNYWTGFRDLTSEEVRAIAREIVNGVRKRGPFLSLGQFVNRSLENSEEGKSGLLQAALDATVNNGSSDAFAEDIDGRFQNIPPNNTQGAAFPGQLLQGDVLQALSPFMQVRSDTFTIRAYGEARNPKTGRTEARAWCEATVQRYPDPLKTTASSKPFMEELANPSGPFGRKFHMVSFRWLHPSEI